MAGDPDLATSRAILGTLTMAGAAAIELGIPYGDPLADGPTIAAAGLRALTAGVGVGDVLALAKDARADGCAPIVLFTYFNPVLQFGIEQFARAAADAGVSGAIVPDIALEEGEALRSALRANNIAMPLLVAPTTKRDRAARICAESSGFVYVVSRLGVTGASATPDFSPLRAQVQMLRALTDKPLAVGFGISSAQHVRAVAPLVDGVVVGSALIDSYAGTRGEEAAARVGAFVHGLLEPTPAP
jgi:tryptophan synthase alpha chain